MKTQVIFVVYKTSTFNKQTVDESVIDFSLDREVADKISELSKGDGIPCRVVKELAATDDGGNELFVIKSSDALDIRKAKKLADFKDHVIGNMSGFDKRVLIASKSLSI